MNVNALNELTQLLIEHVDEHKSLAHEAGRSGTSALQELVKSVQATRRGTLSRSNRLIQEHLCGERLLPFDWLTTQQYEKNRVRDTSTYYLVVG